MSKEPLNMLYSNSPLFFSQIKQAGSTVQTQNKKFTKMPRNEQFTRFTPQMAEEFKRGRYAISPKMRNGTTTVNLESLQNFLKEEGIENPLFRDKILFLMMQGQGALPFTLPKIIADELAVVLSDPFLSAAGDYELSIEKKSSTDITLVINSTIEKRRLSDDPNYTKVKLTDDGDEPLGSPNLVPLVKTCIKVNITPSMVSITDFNVMKFKQETSAEYAEVKASDEAGYPNSEASEEEKSANKLKASDEELALKAFKYLESNQQNILQRLITFISRALGFNSELKLLKTPLKDDLPAASEKVGSPTDETNEYSLVVKI